MACMLVYRDRVLGFIDVMITTFDLNISKNGFHIFRQHKAKRKYRYQTQLGIREEKTEISPDGVWYTSAGNNHYGITWGGKHYYSLSPEDGTV